MPQCYTPRALRRGFTMAELVVVVAILALLMTILVPVIGRVRIQAQSTETRNTLANLQKAIERYQMDFRAYPGVFSNDQICDPQYGSPAIGNKRLRLGKNGSYIDSVTMSENLVLALVGGLRVEPEGSSNPTQVAHFYFDPEFIGKGPASLNLAAPKRNPAYIDAVLTSGILSSSLWTGGTPARFTDDGGIQAEDSVIPEFIDSYGEPLPILYLRARIGAPGVVTKDMKDEKGNRQTYQYDLRQITAYTGVKLNGHKHGLQKLENEDPYDGNWVLMADVKDRNLALGGMTYFMHPQMHGIDNEQGTPRQKDAYILISAGPDRIYGTRDDILHQGSISE